MLKIERQVTSVSLCISWEWFVFLHFLRRCKYSSQHQL